VTRPGSRGWQTTIEQVIIRAREKPYGCGRWIAVQWAKLAITSPPGPPSKASDFSGLLAIMGHTHFSQFGALGYTDLID